MNFSAYYNGGIGLDPVTSEAIYPIIASAIRPVRRVIEFGSGGSTAMLIDSRRESGASYTIDSFDHSEKYRYSGPMPEFLTLRTRPLVTTDDASFDRMFQERVLDRGAFRPAGNVDGDYRAHNCFYDIEVGDISGHYDVVILDGPNGNGRSIAFLHLLGHVGAGTHILIDDYFHYDFYGRCSSLFHCDIIHERRFEGTNKGHMLLRVVQ